MIRYRVEVEDDDTLVAVADDETGGIVTQGENVEHLLGMMIHATMCHVGLAPVAFEIEWPEEGEWPDIEHVSVRRLGQ
jgi:hypothetical protein